MIIFKHINKTKPLTFFIALAVTFLLIGASSSPSLAQEMSQKEADIKNSIKACTDSTAGNPNINAEAVLQTCTCFFTTLINDFPEEERPELAKSHPNPNGTVHEKQMYSIMKKCNLIRS